MRRVKIAFGIRCVKIIKKSYLLSFTFCVNKIFLPSQNGGWRGVRSFPYLISSPEASIGICLPSSLLAKRRREKTGEEFYSKWSSSYCIPEHQMKISFILPIYFIFLSISRGRFCWWVLLVSSPLSPTPPPLPSWVKSIHSTNVIRDSHRTLIMLKQVVEKNSLKNFFL